MGLYYEIHEYMPGYYAWHVFDGDFMERWSPRQGRMVGAFGKKLEDGTYVDGGIVVDKFNERAWYEEGPVNPALLEELETAEGSRKAELEEQISMARRNGKVRDMDLFRTFEEARQHILSKYPEALEKTQYSRG